MSNIVLEVERMKYINKVDDRDIMLFARQNLIGKFVEQRTTMIESAKGFSGWFVEHKFVGSNGKIAKEGYYFLDFSVIYVAGTEKDAMPSAEFMDNVQKKYRAFMAEWFGDVYVADCKRVDDEAKKLAEKYELRAKRNKQVCDLLENNREIGNVETACQTRE